MVRETSQLASPTPTAQDAAMRRIVIWSVLGFLVAVMVQWSWPAKPRWTISLSEPLLHCQFSPDGRALALLSGDKSKRASLTQLEIFDMVTGQELPAPDARRPRVFGDYLWAGVAFSPDGKTVAGLNRDLVLWERTTGRILSRRERESFPGDVRGIAYCPRGRLMGLGFANDRFHILDMDTGEKTATFNVRWGPMHVEQDFAVFFPDKLAKRTALIYEASDRPPWHLDPTAWHADFTPRAKVLVVTVPNGSSMRMVDTESGQAQDVKLPGKVCSALPAVSADARQAAVRIRPEQRDTLFTRFTSWLGLDQKTADAPAIIVLELPSGQVLGTVDGERARFSPDGNLLAVIKNDHTVEIWNLPLQRSLWRILGIGLLCGLFVFVVLISMKWWRTASRNYVSH